MVHSTDQSESPLYQRLAGCGILGNLRTLSLSFVTLQVMVVCPGKSLLSKGKDAVATSISTQFIMKC